MVETTPIVSSIPELTDGTIEGTGVFDTLARSVKAQLKEEFDADRIRGTDYANVFTTSLAQVLSESTNYAVMKAKLAAEIALLEAQTAQVIQETKTSAQQEKLLLAQTSHTAKQELQTVQETLNAKAQELQLQAQTADITKSTDIKSYQLLNILPVEAANLTKNGLNLTAQTGLVTQQTDNLLLEKTHNQEKHTLGMQLTEAQLGKIASETVLVTKQCLLTEAQSLTQGAQTAQINAETRKAEYITSFQIPSQIAATDAQADLTKVQEANTAQNTLNLVAQRDQIDKQTLAIAAETKLKDVEWDIQVHNRDFRLPIELAALQTDAAMKEKQLAIMVKELLVKQAQIDLATKDIALKQNQIDLGTKELLVKQAQLDISAKDLLLKGEQLLITKYELANKMPAEVALVTSQKEFYDQKSVTEKAQVDSTVIGTDSVIAINNNLIKEQAKTFLRSAQQTAAKLMIDTWTVRNQNDPDGNRADANNKLQDSTIGKAVTAVMSGIGVDLTTV